MAVTTHQPGLQEQTWVHTPQAGGQPQPHQVLSLPAKAESFGSKVSAQRKEGWLVRMAREGPGLNSGLDRTHGTSGTCQR